MSVRRLAADAVQPPSFAFTPENQAWAQQQIAKFPPGRQASAVIPLLWRAQEQNDYWLPKAAIEHVASMLGMPYIRVAGGGHLLHDVQPRAGGPALHPALRHHALPPARRRGHHQGLPDAHRRPAQGNAGRQLLVARGRVPGGLLQRAHGADQQRLLRGPDARQLQQAPRRPRCRSPRQARPQNGRRNSEPEGGAQTLTDPTLFDGSLVGAWKKRFAEEEEKARQAAAAKAAEEAAKAEAAKAEATKAEAAAAVENPAPGKPPQGSVLKAVDTPAARVADGKEPVSEADRARNSDASVKLGGTVGEAPAAPLSAAATQPVLPPVGDEFKPELLTAPRDGKGDDLELIWGVGPKLADLLHKLGVFHFSQIASWNEMNLRWIDQNLGSFKGRAVRDKWIEQSAKLATGWRPENSTGDKPQG